LKALWRFFSSVTLSVVLLLTLAIFSAMGTLIPQNLEPEGYLRLLGPFWFRFFETLDLFDLYHSWWFRLLIVLLGANIVVCSIERLSATWKVIFQRRPSSGRLAGSAHRREFEVAQGPEQLAGTCRNLLARGFAWVGSEPRENGVCLLAEKGRYSRLGVYTVHLSVVLLLAGGLIGSIWGYEGFVNIPEGGSADTISLRQGNATLKLPFALRCDDFSVSFYESGQPKEYRSALSVVEADKVVAQKDIIVNDPLRFKGISIFQSSYGKMAPATAPVLGKAPEKVTLRIMGRASSLSYEQQAALNEKIELPEGGGTLVVEQYRPEASFMGQPIGEALVARLTPPEGQAVEVLLPLRFPSFDKMRGGDQVISVVAPLPGHGQPEAKTEQRYFTGLQVAKDPGVPVVYAGFVLRIAGCFITVFISHQQGCIEVVPAEGQSRVTVMGTANRNKAAMDKVVERLARDLAEIKD